MNLYVTSDWHIGHTRIREFEPSRPEDFERVLEENYRATVREEDSCIFLGDIILGNRETRERAAAMFRSLPGRKHLLRGNHDHGTVKSYERMGFDILGLRLGWTQIATPLRRSVTISHLPLVGHDLRYADRIAKMREAVEALRPAAHIHGHTHSRNVDHPLCRNACVEVCDYRPVLVDELVNRRTA